MSANDILDVLNIQRDGVNQPAKKKLKSNDQVAHSRQTGMARELYNLLGPNTPPINLSNNNNANSREKLAFKPSPWTRMPFKANSKNAHGPQLYHWVKGSKEFLERESKEKSYFFDKYNVGVDLPELVDEELFDKFMDEIKEDRKGSEPKQEQPSEEKEEQGENKSSDGEKDGQQDANGVSKDKSETDEGDKQQTSSEKDNEVDDWTYEETKELFELCKAFELKWHLVFDRFRYEGRTLEDLKDHFYKLCAKILEHQENSNPSLIESLQSYSKTKETERKKYLESLLKRTPAEIAEEESLVIEARRFELAAKKMLVERSHLLTLLDSPQSSQSVQQYQSSQGLANLYNNLMILDKHQKKRQLQQQQRSNIPTNQDPVPPPIPVAASSSFKKDRTFQTHLQQYLSGLLKQQQASGVNLKHESSAIQQLLAKRLTVKEEEAYGIYYHANEKLTPGVILRSTQKLPGLQQRQSVLKSVNNVLQELDIPTVGGTNWKPIMPTRKTMTKYDELLRSVVALLDVKRGKDKLESEIKLIKSQRGLQ